MAKETFDRSKPHLNIGTIGHVDHGKTTLTAAITTVLAKAGLSELRSFDSIDNAPEEKERGITITSAVTTCEWKGNEIHIIDTPGHADFGGEVERVLSMVDSVLLLVDAAEGPLPQTRYVLAGVSPKTGNVLWQQRVQAFRGMNILNPALVARAYVFFAYPAQISGDSVWVAVDGVTRATPLAVVAAAHAVEERLLGMQHERGFFRVDSSVLRRDAEFAPTPWVTGWRRCVPPS